MVTKDLKIYGLHNHAMILFLLDTGVSVGELIAIEKDKVDQNSCSAKVIGKGNKKRVVFFSPTTSIAILKYTSSHNSKYLFATEQNRQLDRYNVAKALKRICQRAGVPNYSPHNFRHTFAVNYLHKYPNIYALQQMMGHSSLDMVKLYLVISEQDLKLAHMHASRVDIWNL